MQFYAEMRSHFCIIQVLNTENYLQSISIARAVLVNPRILILDEATSNIDRQTENLVQQVIANLLQGRTSFIIAHRLATVINADKVLVIEQR